MDNPDINLAEGPWCAFVSDAVKSRTSDSSVTISREGVVYDVNGRVIARVCGSLDSVPATAAVLSMAWSYDTQLREFVKRCGKPGFDVDEWRRIFSCTLAETDRRKAHEAPVRM